MPTYPLTDRLVAELRRTLRGRGYSPRTERSYVHWVERFMRAIGHPHPRRLEKAHVERFLKRLANEGRLSPKTTNQAASALAFLFREVLSVDDLRSVKRARGRRKIPTVLSDTEARAVLAEISGRKFLIVALLYGTGMRLSEALALRVKDVDFELERIVVKNGKGGKDRVVMLPRSLQHGLRQQVQRVGKLHERDVAAGGGWVELPWALARKKPAEGRSPAWQYVFPARKTRVNADGRTVRGHLHPSAVQRVVRQAVRRAGVHKPATCHTFRHSFATQMLRDGYDIRVVQALLGHTDVRTTMIYLHVSDHAAPSVRSPLDRQTAPAPLLPPAPPER